MCTTLSERQSVKILKTIYVSQRLAVLILCFVKIVGRGTFMRGYYREHQFRREMKRPRLIIQKERD